MTRLLAATGAGFLFASGLCVSGMTDPARVVAFLDVTGDWNPALALVMASAIAAFALPARWLRGRRPWFAERVLLPTARHVDAPLVAGSVLFGVGWGLAGYCPGPALLGAVATGDGRLFVAAMVAGMAAWALRPAPLGVRRTPTPRLSG